MTITTVTSETTTAPMDAMLALLPPMDANAGRALCAVVQMLVAVVASEQGAAVIVCDTTGEGSGTVLGMGNPLIFAPLAAAAASAMCDTHAEGMLQ